jgi:hypothetical protein
MADPPPKPPHDAELPWEQAGDLTPGAIAVERNRMRAVILASGSEPVPPVVHEVAIGAQTPQSVGVTMAVGIEHLAAVSTHGEANLTINETVIRAFPPDLNGDILKIANDMRSMVPLLQQLVDAQARLGGNVAASVVRLSPDAPRIAELTATMLDEQTHSDQPRMHVVEQCLRVGRMLLLTAMTMLGTLVMGWNVNLSYEALTDPDQAIRHAQNIVSTIEHVLSKLL